MDVWDLESAVSKINDMHRIIAVGEMMKKLANRIQRLLNAMINYMRTTIGKFSALPDFSNVVPSFMLSPSAVQENTEQIHKAVGSLKLTLTRCQDDVEQYLRE
jgi:hypothetical protein